MKILSNDFESNMSSTKRTTGGLVRFASILSEKIIKEGHEWTGLVLVKSKDEKEEPRIVRRKRRGGRNFIEIVIPKVCFTFDDKKSEAVVKKVIKKIAEIIDEEKPSLIFINGFGISQWLMIEGAKLAKVPMVIQHGGIWHKEIDTYKDILKPQAIRRWKKMEKDTVKEVEFHIFLNEHSRKTFFKEVAPVSKERNAIVPLPYDQSYMTDIKTKVKKDKTKVGIVARWDRIKNHNAYLEIAEYANQKKLPFSFFAITTIPKNTKNKDFKNRYQKNIQVIKPKKIAGLRRFYQEMDMMILPSHFETAGFVVMEAALTGTKTIISPNVGWVSEYKKLGMTKWISSFSDPEKVLKQISKITSEQFPKKFIAHIIKHHDPEKVCSAYLDIFLKTGKVVS